MFKEGRDERGEKRRKKGLRQQTQPATSCNGCYQFVLSLYLDLRIHSVYSLHLVLKLCSILALVPRVLYTIMVAFIILQNATQGM